MAKFYNNMELLTKVSRDNKSHVVNVEYVDSLLFEEKSREVVDSEAYYSLETDSTLSGVKQVVTTITDADTQILLTDVNTQVTPVDLTGLTGDGTEYLLYHDRVTHTEKYKESIYARREDIPEGSITLSLDEWNAYSDNLVITASGYVEDTTTP